MKKSELIIWIVVLASLAYALCGCSQAENGQGMEISPAGEAAALAATNLWVPLQLKPLVWLLLAAFGGGVVDRKLLNKKNE